jgi:uncharacterized Zn finger protein
MSPLEIEREIKLCPCCGAKAELSKQAHREYMPTFSIECTACGLGLRDYKNIPQVIAAWNRRE